MHDEPELAGQARQVVATVAPTVVEYLPAPQRRHTASAEADIVIEYLPAWHWRQVESVEAPTVVEYFPVPHEVHDKEPVMVLYVPATQVVHGPPFGPVKPRLQVHEPIVVLAMGDEEWAGHAVHVPPFGP